MDGTAGELLKRRHRGLSRRLDEHLIDEHVRRRERYPCCTLGGVGHERRDHIAATLDEPGDEVLGRWWHDDVDPQAMLLREEGEEVIVEAKLLALVQEVRHGVVPRQHPDGAALLQTIEIEELGFAAVGGHRPLDQKRVEGGFQLRVFLPQAQGNLPPVAQDQRGLDAGAVGADVSEDVAVHDGVGDLAPGDGASEVMLIAGIVDGRDDNASCVLLGEATKGLFMTRLGEHMHRTPREG